MHNANVESPLITSFHMPQRTVKKVELKVFSLRKCFYLKNVCLSIRYSFTTVLQNNYYNATLKIEHLKARNVKKY